MSLVTLPGLEGGILGWGLEVMKICFELIWEKKKNTQIMQKYFIKDIITNRNISIN